MDSIPQFLDFTLFLGKTTEHEYLLNRLLNGVVGTAAQRSAVIRILSQLNKERELERHAIGTLQSRIDIEPPEEKDLQDELDSTKTAVLYMVNFRQTNKNKSIDPVDNYVPTLT